MTTILITGIGGDIAQGIATIVRRVFPDWRIVGMDIHDRHGGALVTDAVYRAPAVPDARYLPWLEDLVAREQVDVCLPTSEAELIELSRLGIDSVGSARLVMANPSAIAVGSDKLRTAEFLNSINISTPWTLPAESFDAATPLPCIFKARRGAGSKSVFVCRSAEDVEFYRARHASAIVQEWLQPDTNEVTCGVYRTRTGEVSVVQLLRTLVGGFTGWAQVIQNAEVESQCRRVAEALDLRGSINVQLRITDAGPRIFEINPRFSSTVLMRHLMGFADVEWSLRESAGQPVVLTQPAVGTIGVRVQGAALCPASSGENR